VTSKDRVEVFDRRTGTDRAEIREQCRKPPVAASGPIQNGCHERRDSATPGGLPGRMRRCARHAGPGCRVRSSSSERRGV
jgi:hypothetical protein